MSTTYAFHSKVLSQAIGYSVFATVSLMSTISIGATSPSSAISSGNQCDKLAAAPNNIDNPKNIAGVEYDDIDAKKAITVCTQAVELNPKVFRYKFQMGRAYDSNAEHDKATKIFHPLALRGYAAAQTDLGVSYRDGLGVKQSYEKSSYWFQKAADQGHIDGQHELGRNYYYGYGVEESDENAMIWFRKAASQGYTLSQYSIGIMYEDGSGVPQSDKEAKKWYKKAADQGYDLAIEKLKEMP